MKKTIYLCDKCGQECQPVRVRQLGTYNGMAIIDKDTKKSYSDVCPSCLSGMYAMTVVRVTRFPEPPLPVSTSNIGEISTIAQHN